MARAYLTKFLIETLFAIFWASNVASFILSGNTLQDAALAMACYYVSVALFEIPTGYFADKYGRKNSTLFGLSLMTLSFLGVGIFPGDWVRLLGLGIAGLGSTFISGAATAWILDYSKTKQHFKDMEMFFLSFDAMGRLAIIAGGLLGAISLTIAPTYTWIAMAVIGVASIVVGYSLPTGEVKLTADTNSIQSKRNSTSLVLLPLSVFFIGSLLFGFDEGIRNTIYQPYLLQLKSGNVMILGYWQMALAVARLGGLEFYRFYLKRHNIGVIYASASIVLFGLVEFTAASSTTFVFVLFAFLVGVFGLGWFFPLKDALLNEIISDEYRATLISVDNMITELGASAMCLVLWSGFAKDNIANAWWVSGTCLIGLGLCLLATNWIRKRRPAMSYA